MIFRDRRQAGERLAAALDDLAGRHDLVIAGLVRGGVPVAAEVAAALGAPLEVLVVRKVGAPTNPEYGIGAVAEGGLVIASPRALALTGVTDQRFEELARAEMAEVKRRVERYRGGRARTSFEGKTVVIVDDGLATGVTARAGIEAVRRMGATEVVLAVPVGSPETAGDLAAVADRIVCLEQPLDFRAVGSWYQDFAQVSDDEVVSALGRAAANGGPAPGG